MRILAVAVGLVALLTLTGCVQGAEPAPTPAASTSVPTQEPTQAPKPTVAPALASITVGGQSVVATDPFGAVLRELVYDAPAPDTIEGFTALFGFDPTLKEVKRGVATDAFSGTIYSWEGFSLAWFGKWADEPDSGLPSVYVSVGAGAVRGTTIVTADGFAVGQRSDLEVQFPDSSESGTTPEGVVYSHAWISCVPIDIPDIPDAADCVSLLATPSDGPISSITAPYSLNHGL